MKCQRCEFVCDVCGGSLSLDDQKHHIHKPIQIIPATGWRAVFQEDEEGKEGFQQVIAWALNGDGDVYPLALADVDGYAEDPRDCSNFLRIEHAGDWKDSP